jgi:hypothetical protein
MRINGNFWEKMGISLLLDRKLRIPTTLQKKEGLYPANIDSDKVLMINSEKIYHLRVSECHFLYFNIISCCLNTF